MNKILLMAAFCLAFYACNQAGTSESPAGDSSVTKAPETTLHKESRNKATALASYKGFETMDMNIVLKDIAPDCVDYGDGTMPVVKGADSIRKHLQAGMAEWMKAFPDFKVGDYSAAASGDTVMLWQVSSGTWKNPYMGQKPTGKSFKIESADVFVFNEAGKIISHRTTPGNFEIAHQIGMKM